MSGRRALYAGPPRYYTRPLPGTHHRVYALLDEFGYVVAEQISCPEGIEVPMPPGTRPLRWRSPVDAAREASATPVDPQLLLSRNRARTFVRAPKPKEVTL